MQTRILGVVSLLCLTFTVIWLVFLITETAAAGPLETFDQVLAHTARLGTAFYLTYLNAALVTVCAITLFALLYLSYKPAAPGWSAVGAVFIPIYGVMNLAVYFSQITVVPRLLELHAGPEFQAQSEFLLRQVIQQWPGSTIWVVNNLAYAVLGVPSIIFGILMLQSSSKLRLAGVLLSLNGAACIAGFAGIIMRSAWLSHGSLIGGVFFLLALAPMSLVFLQKSSPGS
ncbi:MAG: hypothetical protein AB1500_03160 [Bacillota bacterium]